MEDSADEHIEYALAQVFSDRKMQVSEAIKQSCDILSQMTNLTTVVLGPESEQQHLSQVQVLPLGDKSAMAVFETDYGHSESRIFHFEDNIDMNKLQSCCHVLNDRLVGTPLPELVERMELIRPLIAKKIDQYEVLFNAFMNAFMHFAADNMYFSGKSNLIHQPEFSDVEKLKQVMTLLENSSLWRTLGHNQGDLLLQREDSRLIWMNDMAVVSSKIDLGDDENRELMVVGPSRMDYNKIILMMKTLTKAIEQIYGKDTKDE